MIKTKRYLPAVFFAVLTLIVFRNFFLKELHPYPGNFLLAWFEPFKSDYFINGVITIVHKPLASDIFRQIYPFKTLAADMIKDGLFPLWNPYNGAGMPFLATQNIGLLDPFNILYLILPSPFAWSILIILHFFFIGIFTYIYALKIGLSKLTSIAASIIFLFSGFVIMRLIFGIYGPTLALIPFVLYLFEDYLKNPKSKKIYILPFAIFINIVSGQPQISLYVLIFWLMYLIFRLVQTKGDIVIKFKLGFLPFILFFLGFGLSAIQLLPTFELFKYANINRASAEFIFKNYLLPASHLLGLPIPNYFGSDATYNFFGSGDTIESVIYVGLIPLFLAVFAIFIRPITKKPDLRLFFLFSTILSIFLTLDWSLPKFLYSFSIPIISTGIPSRIFILSTFCISILAGIGLDTLITNLKDKKTRNFILIFSSFVVILLFATFALKEFNFPCPQRLEDCRNISLRNTVFEMLSYVLFLLAIVFTLRYKTKTKYFLITVIAITTVFGLYNSNKFLPFSPVSTFHPNNNLINAIKEKTLDARVFGIDSANVSTDLATLFRFYNPDYYHPLYIKRYGELIGYANTGKVDIVLPRSDVDIVRDSKIPEDQSERRKRLFTLTSTKYLVFKKTEASKSKNTLWQDDKWYIQANSSLPRAYTVNDYEVIKDRKQILTSLFNKDFDPYSKVILEEDLSLETNQKVLDSKIELREDKGNKISILTDSKYNSILVLTDNYYPGWKAFVDGRETKVYRANYTFRSIFIAKGKHFVKFVYNPDSFSKGLRISLISFAIIGIIFIFTNFFLRPARSRQL